MISRFLKRNKSDNQTHEIIHKTTVIDHTSSSYVILRIQDETAIKKINPYIFLLKPDTKRCFLIFNKGYEQRKAPLTYAMLSGNCWQVSIAKNSLIQIYFPIMIELTQDPSAYARLYLDQKYASSKMLVTSSTIIHESGDLSLLCYTTAPTYITSNDFMAVLEIPTRNNVLVTKEQDYVQKTL